MDVSQRMYELLAEYNQLTFNPYLNAIDINFIRFLEDHTAQFKYGEKYLQQIFKIADNTHIEDLDNHFRLYSKYAEAKSYVFLVQKDLQIEVLQDKGMDGKGNPDFQVLLDDGSCFIEVKALQMAEGVYNANGILQESFEKQVEFDRRVRAKGLAIGVQAIDPHKSSDSKNAASGVLFTLINDLINKFDQNFKTDQYARGDTVAMIFLSALVYPMYGYGEIRHKITQHYYGPYRQPISGELWMAAYGEPGMPIYVPADSSSGPNLAGYMDRHGILRQKSAVEALCFYVQGLDPESTQLAVLYRSGADHRMKSLLTKLTNYYNDESGAESDRLI